MPETQEPSQPAPIGPPAHPWREKLIEELHARPHVVVAAPAQIFHLAVLTELTADEERQRLAELCARHALKPPTPHASHFGADGPGFALTWERHTEFSTYSFVQRLGDAPMFDEAQQTRLPSAWLDQLAGQTIAAIRVEILDRAAPVPDPATIDRLFGGANVVGGLAAAGRVQLWTDFQLAADGALRILMRDSGMSPRQTGRTAQRLLEIHTYCMMALLALPLAREIAPAIARMERELSDTAQTVQSVVDPDDEREQLRRLSALAAEIEGLAARTPYRFGAARAYHALVMRRIEELREQRIEGQQTIGEFMERRLGPAMRTCETMERRLDSLSERVARASEMLRTRVDVTLEAQNRDLLASMDRRARQQLKLQRTVEGLSVAAITYYAVGLLSYVTAGIAAAGAHVSKEIVTAIAVPTLAAVAWLGLRRLHRKFKDD